MNDDLIYEKLEEIPSNPHYLVRYYNFLKHCRKSNSSLPSKVYTEKHHICPKSMFPEYKNFKLHSWNLSILTARQHFIAHWMLAKAYGKGMWFALYVLVKMATPHQQRDFFISSRTYENVITNANAYRSLSYTGRGNPNYGKLHSAETKSKISEALTGRVGHKYWLGKQHSDITKEKISKSGKGKVHSEESRRKMSYSLKSAPRLKCPHCQKTGSPTNMNRYHFENCYLSPNFNPSAIASRAHSESAKSKMSDAKRGKKQPIVKCPYCNKSGGKPSMHIWHFDRCKYKP